ncbi:hypothetical protein C8P64_1769 [Christiangramia gaetbulicola]|uniref:Hydrolase n=1 Tax=Christiangramia gaetbulicola TaxID=703340 RepID=A0A2T6AHE5_9FLAO|nr:hypothetical protein [Christiangramia gaetbulicola]PTX43243.1 hypothetical protein C8P64_1769 [Christiangramia gaetbulicola]
MRNKILMYLFIFSVLFTLFIYVNDKRILDSKQDKIDRLEEKLAEVEADAQIPSEVAEVEDYFNLENNEDAITYFENKGIDTQDLILKIEDAIISQNSAEEDNPLVPQAGMEGKMRINKIKVLNHKWIIADFTDGTYWGEVFLSYEVAEDGEIRFYPEKSFLYPLY